MTSKEMLKAALPAGCIFKNIAKIGRKPDWKIVSAPAGWFPNKTGGNQE